MTATIRNVLHALALAGMFFLFSGLGCRVSYSLSGASIHADARTVSIPYFPNGSTYVIPTLSAAFTEAMQNKFASQTRLELVNEEGDLAFSGEIVRTTFTPTAVTADPEYPASQTRMEITVRVNFENRLEPEFSFEGRTFSQYVDFPATQTPQSAEADLSPTIIGMLVDDIYQAAVANW